MHIVNPRLKQRLHRQPPFPFDVDDYISSASFADVRSLICLLHRQFIVSVLCVQYDGNLSFFGQKTGTLSTFRFCVLLLLLFVRQDSDTAPFPVLLYDDPVRNILDQFLTMADDTH